MLLDSNHRQGLLLLLILEVFLKTLHNSAEVEQETEQENECSELAVCANVIVVQTQTGAAAVAKFRHYQDV